MNRAKALHVLARASHASGAATLYRTGGSECLIASGDFIWMT